MPQRIGLSGSIQSILAAIHTVPIPAKPGERVPEHPVEPFITISRQPGAGAWTLARQLVDALNESFPAEQPWSCWERELVEKVAADHQLSAPLIESLEDRGHTWFSDFLESLSFSDSAVQDESKIYARVAKTIRGLAQAGRVVIVGRGGVFITRKMPGGIHLRLVAPFEQRVAFMAREYNLTHEKAAARVRDLERNRQTFYHRYWPHESLSPENFSLTINTAMVDQSTIIQTVTSLVRKAAPARRE